MQNTDEPVHVLVACAEVDYGAALAEFLAYSGYAVERVHDAAGVLRVASRRGFDVTVLDLELDAGSDMDLVTFLREQDPVGRVILLFGMARLERALEGIRQGAHFYLPRTSPPSDVALAVEKAARSRQLADQVDAYEDLVFEQLVGRTEAMGRVVELIRKVAPTDSTVLLLGESGTGKEVLAHALHRLSRRSQRPFVAINCAALPESLLESEMFGHVKGAFTGAEHDKRGLFEEADGGTLFLDEIGDMAPITQAKLLRVLQNGEIRPVGSAVSRKVDVRVIAATNRDLEEAVARNACREDLYFRLNVITIRIPPLRERMDALPSLVAHFIQKSNQRYGRAVRGMDDHAMSLLGHYDFPGNVRELESIVGHAVILADEEVVRARDLPEQVRSGGGRRLQLPYQAEAGVLTHAQVEERHIREVLARLSGNQSLAAKKLGISRSTLWRKMREYGIERESA